MKWIRSTQRDFLRKMPVHRKIRPNLLSFGLMAPCTGSSDDSYDIHTRSPRPPLDRLGDPARAATSPNAPSSSSARRREEAEARARAWITSIYKSPLNDSLRIRLNADTAVMVTSLPTLSFGGLGVD